MNFANFENKKPAKRNVGGRFILVAHWRLELQTP